MFAHDAPSDVATTVLLVPGGQIGTQIPGSLLGFDNLIIDVSGGEGSRLLAANSSQLTVSDGSFSRLLVEDLLLGHHRRGNFSPNQTVRSGPARGHELMPPHSPRGAPVIIEATCRRVRRTDPANSRRDLARAIRGHVPAL